MDTKALMERYKQYLFPAAAPLYGDDPLIVDRAKDQYVWDTDGKRYLDFFGGVLTVSLGRCHAELRRVWPSALRGAARTGIAQPWRGRHIGIERRKFAHRRSGLAASSGCAADREARRPHPVLRCHDARQIDHVSGQRR